MEWMAGGRCDIPGPEKDPSWSGWRLLRSGEVVWSFDEEGDISSKELRSRVFEMTGFRSWRTQVSENPRTGVLVLTRRMSAKKPDTQLTPELWAPARGWLRIARGENQ